MISDIVNQMKITLGCIRTRKLESERLGIRIDPPQIQRLSISRRPLIRHDKDLTTRAKR